MATTTHVSRTWMMNAKKLEQQVKATVAARALSLRYALYLKRRNPIHAWRAYATARQWNVAIPNWVLDYFDACAKTLTTPKHASAKGIADALGLGTRGGPSVTRQAETDERNLAIVVRIDQLKGRPTRAQLRALADAHGLTGDLVDPGDRTLLVIFDQVAGEYDLDVNQIQAIYYQMIRPPKRPRKRL